MLSAGAWPLAEASQRAVNVASLLAGGVASVAGRLMRGVQAGEFNADEFVKTIGRERWVGTWPSVTPPSVGGRGGTRC